MLRAVCTVLLIGAMSCLCGVCAADATPPGNHQLAIGVVNVTRVLRQMHETAKLEQEFRAQNTNLAQQQRQKEVEIEEIQKHRENFKPGSPQYDDETDKINLKRGELELWKQMSNMKLELAYKRSLKGIYDHIATAAAQVAEQQHFDLVIADQMPEIGADLDKAPVATLQAALAARAVLFSNKKADITEQVLTQVEANFSAQPAVGSTSPALINPAGPVGPK
jgi:Skp family chaperone for outer membrane proteins